MSRGLNVRIRLEAHRHSDGEILLPWRISLVRNDEVAFGEKRTSEGRQDRRHRSRLTQLGH